MTTENRTHRFMAIDMGAESARANVGHIRKDAIEMEEIHRWSSRNTTVNGTRYWDVLYMFSEIKHALGKYAQRFGTELDGIGIDSWGVDFGILGKSGHLLQNPVHYRDHRTDGLIEKSSEILSREDLYAETGIAFMPFNSLYQLWALKNSAPELLREGRCFLMISDLLHYFLSGTAACEYTNASTTQLLDVRTRQWSERIFRDFDLPLDTMPEILEPGTVLGPLKEDICADTGVTRCDVITPCTHDTASAVLAVPADESEDWAYISCGTWSLMGAELASPITDPTALAANFTNEGGQGNTIRFLKNIMGLWVLQGARASWAWRGENYNYAELTEMADSAAAFDVVLNIDDPIFFNPDDMLDAIAEHCTQTGQSPPKNVAATTRAILEGIALRYAVTLNDLERATKRSFTRIHMVGGGIKNELLCQMASDAMGRSVVAGPVEGTALGNIVSQAIGKGILHDRVAARRLIANSVTLKTYEPSSHDDWVRHVEKECS